MMELLENEMIRLRALEPEDLELLYRWENDSKFWNKGNTVTPYSRYALKQYIAEAHRDIYELRQMRLAIDQVATGETIGMIDLYDFDPHNRKAGIGIFLDETYQGNGHATQALNLLMNYSFSFLRLHQLYAYVSVRNEASKALFSRCGFTESAILKDWICDPDGFSDILVMQYIHKMSVL